MSTSPPADPLSLPAASSSPLDILLDPSVYSGVLPDDHDLAAALATFDPQQPASINKTKKKHWIKSQLASPKKMEEMYTKLAELCFKN